MNAPLIGRATIAKGEFAMFSSRLSWRSVLGVACLLMAAPAASVNLQAQGADEWAAHAKENEGNEGLGHLAAALKAFAGPPQGSANEALTEIIREGWRQPHPEVVEALRQNWEALGEFHKAGGYQDLRLPPADVANFKSAGTPNFLATQVLTKLLVARARQLEAEGQVGQALDTALRAAWIASFYMGDEQPILSRLIGIACLHISLQAVEDLIRNPAADAEVVRGAGSQLYRIDQRIPGMGSAFMVEAAIGRAQLPEMHTEMRKKMEAATPEQVEAELAKLPPAQRAMAKEMMNLDSESLLAGHEKVWRAVLENMDRPYRERETMDSAWFDRLSPNPIYNMMMPNFLEAGTRDDAVRARLRACQAARALRIGNAELAASTKDPFTGDPLKVTETSVYSLGPDAADQQGQVLYDPTNGTVSAGDVVVGR
ncbi:MAG: hypothetical protein SF028_11765 [Candidatus Sumerlaeia bacterium]|nr:hypothetical protein [Candidatus Sumerlaeia bacterium]